MVSFPISESKQKKLLERMQVLGIQEVDIHESFVRGSGRGGQKINKTSSCVVLKHLPTGISVKCQKERQRSLNRFLARRLLADKIEQHLTGNILEKSKKMEKIRKQKKKRRKKAVLKIQEKKIN